MGILSDCALSAVPVWRFLVVYCLYFFCLCADPISGLSGSLYFQLLPHKTWCDPEDSGRMEAGFLDVWKGSPYGNFMGFSVADGSTGGNFVGMP